MRRTCFDEPKSRLVGYDVVGTTKSRGAEQKRGSYQTRLDLARHLNSAFGAEYQGLTIWQKQTNGQFLDEGSSASKSRYDDQGTVAR